MNRQTKSKTSRPADGTSSANSPSTHPQAASPNMVIAPVAKGIIIVSSLVVAAGIALYENPQVREWVLNSRRKIAVALEDLAGEIRPSRNETEVGGRSPRSPTTPEPKDDVEMAATSTGNDHTGNHVRRRNQPPDELNNHVELFPSPSNQPALFPSSQTVSKSGFADQSFLGAQNSLDSASPPSFESTPRGDIDENLDAPVVRPNLNIQPITTNATSTSVEIENEEVKTPILTSNGLDFSQNLNHGIPQSPGTERDIDFVSDAGNETASSIEYDDVSEMGGWSEVGSVSGDEDMLLGAGSKHL